MRADAVQSVAAEWDDELLGRGSARRTLVEQARSLDEIMSVGLFRHPEGPIPLRPVLVAEGQAARMVATTRALTRAIARACARRADSMSHLADLLGYERPAQSLLTESPAANRWALAHVRPDIVVQDGVLKFLEFNFNSAVLGPEQLGRLDRFFWRTPAARTVAQRGPIASWGGLSARRDLVVRAARAFSGRRRPRVAVLGWDAGDGWGSDRYFEDVVADFRAAGTPVTFCVPADLAYGPGRLTARGVPVDVVLRMFVTADAPLAELDLTALREAVLADDVLVIAPEAGGLHASKRVLTWLWEDLETADPSTRDLVVRHVPWTHHVRECEVGWRDGSFALPDLLVRRKDDFVLKPFTRHGGDGVVMGRLVEQDDWERLVDGAVHRGDRVVQEFVEPDPVTVPMYLPAADEVIRAEVTCVFGPLVTDRRVGGIVARHMAGTTSGVVNAIGGGTTNSAFVVG